MSVSVKAIFENGKVVLTEPPPTNDNVPVLILFPEIKQSLQKNEIRFGSLANKIDIPENFDDALNELKDYME